MNLRKYWYKRGPSTRKYSKEQHEEIVRLRVEENKTPGTIANMMGIPVKVVHGILYVNNTYLPTKVYRVAGENRWDFTEHNIEVRD